MKRGERTRGRGDAHARCTRTLAELEDHDAFVARHIGTTPTTRRRCSRRWASHRAPR